MLPTIDIQIHEIILRCFYFPKIYGPREKLDADIKEFKGFVEEYGERVLMDIEKFAGWVWTRPKIPVVLVPNNAMVKYSYSLFNLEENLPGIVQKIGLGSKRDAFIFIHELVHTNQKHSRDFYGENGFAFNKERERDVDLLEGCADIVTLYVLRSIFGTDSEYEKNFFDFLQNTNEKNVQKYNVLVKYLEKWDLNKFPLKHWLEEETRTK